jgi:hypothetical protein
MKTCKPLLVALFFSQSRRWEPVESWVKEKPPEAKENDQTQTVCQEDLGGLNLKAVDLGQMEDMLNGDLNIAHSLGPLRPNLPKSAKFSFKLLYNILVDSDADKRGKGDVVTSLFQKGNGERERYCDGGELECWRLEGGPRGDRSSAA